MPIKHGNHMNLSECYGFVKVIPLQFVLVSINRMKISLTALRYGITSSRIKDKTCIFFENVNDNVS